MKSEHSTSQLLIGRRFAVLSLLGSGVALNAGVADIPGAGLERAHAILNYLLSSNIGRDVWQ